MNHEMLLDHLRIAQRHVLEGAQHVSRQRDLIAELEEDGHDTGDALRLLRQFEELQALHVADRDRLQEELTRIAKDCDR